MSSSPQKPKSCTGRLFGTLFAFITAAAVVYIGSFLILFQVTGLPARSEASWLGAPLRFLSSAPFLESGDTYLYKGDTAPYKLFRPLNSAWLKWKDVPDTPPPAAAEEGEADEKPRGDRRGRSDDGKTTGTASGDSNRGESASAADDSTTGTDNVDADETPRRRRRRPEGEAVNRGEGTEEQADDAAPGDRPRRRRPTSQSDDSGTTASQE